MVVTGSGKGVGLGRGCTGEETAVSVSPKMTAVGVSVISAVGVCAGSLVDVADTVTAGVRDGAADGVGVSVDVSVAVDEGGRVGSGV